MIVALVALFSSLAGGATAAKLITGKQIKNGSITGKDVKKSSLTSRHVKNGTLLVRDFKAGQLSESAIGPEGSDGSDGSDGTSGSDGSDGTDGTDGATGPMGPPGPQGPEGPRGVKGDTGDQGQAGRDGFNIVTYRRGGSVMTVAGGGMAMQYVACPSGTRPIGGGAVPSNYDLVVSFSAAGRDPGTYGQWHTETPTGWVAGMKNTSNQSRTFQTYAVCGQATGVDIDY